MSNKVTKSLAVCLLATIVAPNGTLWAEDITIERTHATGRYLDEVNLKRALLENYKVEAILFSIETETRGSDGVSHPVTRSIYTAKLAIENQAFRNENKMWDLFSRIIPSILWLSADCRKAETLRIEVGSVGELVRDGNNSRFSTSRTYELSLQKLLDHHTEMTAKKLGSDESFFSAGYE